MMDVDGRQTTGGPWTGVHEQYRSLRANQNIQLTEKELSKSLFIIINNFYDFFLVEYSDHVWFSNSEVLIRKAKG